MIVVDASAVIEVPLEKPAAARVGNRLFAPGETLHAPHLLDVEVAHVLRRFCLAGQISPERGAEALRDLAALRLRRYSHRASLPRVWELRHILTAYDALAEALAAPLVTCDAALAASPGHEACIELI